jgi:hypothetical protein
MFTFEFPMAFGPAYFMDILQVSTSGLRDELHEAMHSRGPSQQK